MPAVKESPIVKILTLFVFVLAAVAGKDAIVSSIAKMSISDSSFFILFPLFIFNLPSVSKTREEKVYFICIVGVDCQICSICTELVFLLELNGLDGRFTCTEGCSGVGSGCDGLGGVSTG